MRVVLSNQNCQLSGFMFIYAGRLKDQKDFPRDPFFFFSYILVLCVVQKVGVAIKKVKKREKKERPCRSPWVIYGQRAADIVDEQSQGRV